METLKSLNGYILTDLKVVSTKAMDWAAKNGHFDVVRWLYLNRSEGCSTDAMRSKRIAIVRYLFENGLVTDRKKLKMHWKLLRVVGAM